MKKADTTTKGMARAGNLLQQIQSMVVVEKIQLALHAGKEARGILIKDPNKQVAMAVINSPKITEDEILLIAQSRNVSDEVLRTIAKNRNWVKKYPVCLALINNPRTPAGIAQSFLPRVKTRDIAMLVKNRNVPAAVRASADRLLKMRHL